GQGQDLRPERREDLRRRCDCPTQGASEGHAVAAQDRLSGPWRTTGECGGWLGAGRSVVRRICLAVAQSCTLLYRRIPFCRSSPNTTAPEWLDALPITNRRYSRVQLCATSPLLALNTYRTASGVRRRAGSRSVFA